LGIPYKTIQEDYETKKHLIRRKREMREERSLGGGGGGGQGGTTNCRAVRKHRVGEKKKEGRDAFKTSTFLPGGGKRAKQVFVKKRIMRASRQRRGVRHWGGRDLG